ncbi:MAG: hypothetical protein CML40_09345 [Rhodobacteraceae bacterium]|nr:MAG: hypothetical protein CML40_09345 [Paracoccaceae bacterium]|tara:strand:+ start:517 stop:843 length:327 start_codon:yes stop_codon:yes gene_type:complete
MSIHHTDQLDWAPKKSKDIQSLQKFQKNIASSLLQYTEDEDENKTNSKLVSALLFMLHISSEIVKSFTYGDETDTKELLDEAITEANFAYKNRDGLDLTDTLNKAKMN